MERYHETQQTWHKLAQLYENNFMHLDLYNPSYDRFLQQLQGNKPSVLEIGCGPGNISHYLLQQRPELNILGIDTGPAMVELAQKNNPTASFQVMDARHITQLPKSFDGILIGFCIPYLEPDDTAMLITHCHELLNKNGILYLSYVPGDPALSDFQTGSSGDRIYFHFYSNEWILEELQRHSFILTDQVPVTYTRSNGNTELHQIVIAKKQKP